MQQHQVQCAASRLPYVDAPPCHPKLQTGSFAVLCFFHLHTMLQGRTALMSAAAVGDAVMVEKLLTAGADVCLASAEASHMKVLWQWLCSADFGGQVIMVY